MTSSPSRPVRSSWLAAGIIAVAGAVLFHCFGNATRGYVNTPSAFWWWISQWLDPRAETEHGWLIAAISAWLLWRGVRIAECGVRSADLKTPIARAGGSPDAVPTDEVCDPALSSQSAIRDPRSAIAALLTALLLHGVAFVAQQTRLSLVALLLFTWGVLRLGGGPRWGRAAAFPLVFLLFAIPINVLDSVGFWLRMWVVDAAGTFARVVHIPVLRSGTQLISPDGRYQYDVAAACSGVRSLMALAALSLLIGYLNFRSVWRRLLVLALCFPLTYLGNLVRIGAIIVAAHLGGQRWGERAHDVMGFGVFVIVLGGVLLAARGIERWWPETPNDGAATSASADRAAGDSRPYLPWVVAALMVGLSIAEMGWLARVQADAPAGASGVRLAVDGTNPVDLPAFVGTDWIGARAEVTDVERAILPPDTGFSRRRYVSVQDPRHSVFLSLVLSGRDRTSIHRPELCLVGQGWTLESGGTGNFAVGGGAIPTTLLRASRIDPRTGKVAHALVAYWFVSADRVVPSHVQRFLYDAWNRVRHGRADRWAYVLLLTDADDGDAAALRRMQPVLDAAVPVFQKVR